MSPMNGSPRLPTPTKVAEHFPAIAELAALINLPVWVIDLESTGFGAHRSLGIVEFASIHIPPDGQSTAFSTLIDPEVPIHWAATKVHGIDEPAVRGAPTFLGIANGLRRGLSTTLVCGFNSRPYDLKVIQGNAERYGLDPLIAVNQLDVRDIWVGLHGKKGTLGQAADKYQVQSGPAHRAHGDVLTTARLLDAILTRMGPEFARQYLTRTEPEETCILTTS
ncbi:TPA: exonuclease domain-containing protein [Pseudomonas aeruginosa]|uniref:3'-5' exonuclease n=2 Tax=Pseudomonas aeruginosa TaxID=287 RepID=UPI0009AB5622